MPMKRKDTVDCTVAQAWLLQKEAGERLNRRLQKKLQKHIEECSDCRAWEQAARQYQAVLPFAAEKAPASLQDNVMRAVRNTAPLKKPASRVRLRRVGAISTACVVILIGAVLLSPTFRGANSAAPSETYKKSDSKEGDTNTTVLYDQEKAISESANKKAADSRIDYSAADVDSSQAFTEKTESESVNNERILCWKTEEYALYKTEKRDVYILRTPAGECVLTPQSLDPCLLIGTQNGKTVTVRLHTDAAGNVTPEVLP